MSTYSFLDVKCSIVGLGINANLAAGASAAEEGITITASEAVNTMTVGADGEGMHSLHANKSGVATIRLLKTSPINALLAQAYAVQTASGAAHGNNQITLSNSQTQDLISCRQCAFQKAPDLTYAKEGGINEWIFDVIKIDRALGSNV
jgi:hypothetical protein